MSLEIWMVWKLLLYLFTALPSFPMRNFSKFQAISLRLTGFQMICKVKYTIVLTGIKYQINFKQVYFVHVVFWLVLNSITYYTLHTWIYISHLQFVKKINTWSNKIFCTLEVNGLYLQRTTDDLIKTWIVPGLQMKCR